MMDDCININLVFTRTLFDNLQCFLANAFWLKRLTPSVEKLSDKIQNMLLSIGVDV